MEQHNTNNTERGSFNTLLLFPVVVVALVAAAAVGMRGNGASNAAPPEQKPVTVKRLTGHISRVSPEFKLTLSAILIERNKVDHDGVFGAEGFYQVQGMSVDGLRGSVVEVAPPGDTYDHWCINAAVNNDPDLDGLNILWYVRDVGDGNSTFDELTAQAGFGLSCAENPAPTAAFAPVDSGDFKSSL